MGESAAMLAACLITGVASCGIGWWHGRRYERELRDRARHA